MGIDESKTEEVIESFKKAGVKEEKTEIEEKEKTWKVIAKYFVHGAAFSVIFTILAMLWLFGLLILIVLGSFIGLIIGLGILMVIIGGLNSALTSVLWFPVRTSFWSILGHGFVLSIVLLIVNGIFVMIPTLAFPEASTTAITFIIASFLDGFVAKKVAGLWRQEYREDISEDIEAEWRDKEL